jgi:predicted permease
MHIVNETKFIIGILFAVIGLGLLISARRSRGFNQRKQAGVLFLIAAIVFVAIGLGQLDIDALLGRR